MASKYAFGQGLKELRFLFCQTSEHSAATRYVTTMLRAGIAMRALLEAFGWDTKSFRLTVLSRNFLTKSYPTMKKHNPHTPIMIREASGTEPTVYARFGASHVQEKCDGTNTCGI